MILTPSTRWWFFFSYVWYTTFCEKDKGVTDGHTFFVYFVVSSSSLGANME